MARGKFRYNSLLKLRKNRLDVARRHLARFASKLVELNEEIEEVKKSRLQCLGFDESLKKIGGLTYGGQVAGALTQKLVTLRQEVKQNEIEFDRHQRWVSELNKEFKIIEKLKERSTEKEHALKKKADNMFLDSWVVERWKR